MGWIELTACELFSGELDQLRRGQNRPLAFSSEIAEIWRYSSEISVSSLSEISSELAISSARNKLGDTGKS